MVEATTLLEAARDQSALSVERGKAFARACLARDRIARAALNILDGGAFAGARLVELASLLHAEASTHEGEVSETGS